MRSRLQLGLRLEKITQLLLPDGQAPKLLLAPARLNRYQRCRNGDACTTIIHISVSRTRIRPYRMASGHDCHGFRAGGSGCRGCLVLCCCMQLTPLLGLTRVKCGLPDWTREGRFSLLEIAMPFGHKHRIPS